jgi:hypothetical protein
MAGEQTPVPPGAQTLPCPQLRVATAEAKEPAGGVIVKAARTVTVSAVRCEFGSVPVGPGVAAGVALFAVSAAVIVPVLVEPVTLAFALLQFNCCVPFVVGHTMGAGKPVPVMVIGAKP